MAECGSDDTVEVMAVLNWVKLHRLEILGTAGDRKSGMNRTVLAVARSRDVALVDCFSVCSVLCILCCVQLEICSI